MLFTHPTYNAMKPCPFYLNGKCKFEDTCKFSHGHVVLFSELLTYQEPDYRCVISGDGYIRPVDLLFQSRLCRGQVYCKVF